MHFLLIYEFAEDYLQRRVPYRGEHLRLAWEAPLATRAPAPLYCFRAQTIGRRALLLPPILTQSPAW